MSNDRSPRRLFELLTARARDRPDAVLTVRDGAAVSNREAQDDALGLAAGLRSLAAPSPAASRTEPRIVAAMLNDAHDLHRLIWAARAADCGLALLSVVRDPDQVRTLMGQVGARHLVTDIPSLLERDFALSLADLARPDPHVGRPGHGRGPAFLLRTSGTTGSGKWVAVEDRQIMLVLEAMHGAGALRHAADQLAFLTPPLSHSYGLSTLFEYVSAGSAVVFPRGTSPLGPAGELRDRGLAESITAIEGVASFHGQLARLLGGVRLPALRHLGFGGDRLDREALTRLSQACPGITCSVRYGLTETPSIVSGMVFRPPPEDGASYAGTVLPIWEVRIVDDRGRPLPDGQEGEIQLRGPCLAWPYYGEPEDGNAFFATGDLGVLTAGRLTIRGRKSLFIKHAGYRFSPEDVEAVLRLFDGVLDTRVSLRDGTLTAEVVSASENLPKQALRAFAAERLPPHAVPQNLVQVAEIPRTESGKIKRSPPPLQPTPPAPGDTPQNHQPTEVL